MTDSYTDQLIDTLFNLSRSMKDSMCFSTEFTNLSVNQIQALIYIRKNEEIPMSEIAQKFKIEMPSATSLVNKLSLLKLVERKSDDADRRLVKIFLTAKGKRMLEKVTDERSKNIKKIIAFLSESDRKDLLRISKTLLQQLEKDHEK